MTICGIALGGNIGNTADRFRAALTGLEQRGLQVRSISSFHATPAMGAHAGSEFLNAAALVETTKSAFSTLTILHEIEDQLGRLRSTHWGPRTIDLDLIFFGDDVIDRHDIVVPHPQLWYRRFVLNPFSEIAPEWVHPVLNESIEGLVNRLNCRPLMIQIALHDTTSLEWDSLKQGCADAAVGNDVIFVQSVDANIRENIAARITIVPAVKGSADRSQPKNSPRREITVEADSETEVIQCVRDVVTAML